jgi:hypothetical protein
MTSHKLTYQTFGFESHWLLGLVPGDGTKALQSSGEYTYEQGELRGIVGEVRKQTDVPLYTGIKVTHLSLHIK